MGLAVGNGGHYAKTDNVQKSTVVFLLLILPIMCDGFIFANQNNSLVKCDREHALYDTDIVRAKLFRKF